MFVKKGPVSIIHNRPDDSRGDGVGRGGQERPSAPDRPRLQRKDTSSSCLLCGARPEQIPVSLRSYLKRAPDAFNN